MGTHTIGYGYPQRRARSISLSGVREKKPHIAEAGAMAHLALGSDRDYSAV
jgi:hypothetical protein